MKKHSLNLTIRARDDGTLEAAYIQLASAAVVRTEEHLESVLLLDFDKGDNLVGIEILAPVSIALVKSVAKRLGAEQRKQFHKFIKTYAPESLVTAK